MEQILLGTTDRSIPIFISDPAQSDGSGKTGLVAANLKASYVRVETDNDVTVTDVTSSLNNLSALTDAHNDWGLLEVSSTLAPGLYRLDIADAVFASGAWYAVVYVMISTSEAAPVPKQFVLVNNTFNTSAEATALANKIADHCRRRTQANVEASSDGDTLSVGSEYGLIQQNQESNLVDNPGKLTVYKTDGTTELAQKTIDSDPSAEPVTGIS